MFNKFYVLNEKPARNRQILAHNSSGLDYKTSCMLEWMHYARFYKKFRDVSTVKQKLVAFLRYETLYNQAGRLFNQITATQQDLKVDSLCRWYLHEPRVLGAYCTNIGFWFNSNICYSCINELKSVIILTNLGEI